jgi:hypothetical protein
VLTLPDLGLDTMQRVESVCVIPLSAGVLRLLVSAMGARVIIDRHCVVVGVEVTR